MFKGIDFYSDTVTRPTQAMKQAMIEAETGDEQKGEDPTTRKLEERVAELLGHSAALFFPSATMANEVALRLLTHAGDEIIAYSNCHLFFAETGGPAVHAALMCKPVHTSNGIFTSEDVKANYRWSTGSHYPVTKLVAVENTTNMGGGIAWSEEELNSVLTTAKELGLSTHLDGARLWNASIATQRKLSALASPFTTATVCFSKGMGCPTGAVLAFEKSRWAEVRRLKQLMGGAMRQSGILSACALYALDNHYTRLSEDHENASRLASGLSEGVKFLTVEPREKLSTNMVYFRWRHLKVPTETLLLDCEKKGVRFSQVDRDRVRAVLHLDISKEDVTRAIGILKETAQSYGT